MNFYIEKINPNDKIPFLDCISSRYGIRAGDDNNTLEMTWYKTKKQRDDEWDRLVLCRNLPIQ
tara:strand:+ start:1010 stop:1198 length:189 start_codon:yes stop_codon:yes gene_type:complete